MARVKNTLLQEPVVETQPEQTLEEFLAVMEANERGYYVNITQPNATQLDIIASLKDLVYAGSSLPDEVVKAATEKILEAIDNLKIKVDEE